MKLTKFEPFKVERYKNFTPDRNRLVVQLLSLYWRGRECSLSPHTTRLSVQQSYTLPISYNEALREAIIRGVPISVSESSRFSKRLVLMIDAVRIRIYYYYKRHSCHTLKLLMHSD